MGFDMLSAFDGFARGEQATPETRVVAAGYRLKRALDILLAGGGLLFLAPALILIVIALLIVDGRPISFSHTRVGRYGRPFRCLKFRSMRTDAAERLAEILATDPVRRAEWQETQKLMNDPRVHWLGKLLRMTSADELPQLINVLRGEMSLVGPRPIIAEEIERYGANAHVYLSMTPGLTGMWQVNRRQDTSYEERVQYDLDYYRTCSFTTDIGILWKTVGVVFFAQNEKERLTK